MRRTVKIFDELFSVTYSYMLGPLLYKIRVCSAMGLHGIVPIDPIAEQIVRYWSGSRTVWLRWRNKKDDGETLLWMVRSRRLLLFIFAATHVIFSDCSWAQITEAAETKTM